MPSHVVLTTDFPPSTGGIQQYVQQIWGDGSIGPVAVIAPKTPGYAAFDATFPGRVLRLPAGPPFGGAGYLAGVAATLPRFVRGDAAVHVANVLLAPSLLPYLPFFRGRLIAYTHALEVTHPRLRAPIATLLSRADAVSVISDYGQSLALAHGARAERIVRISPGGDSLRKRFPSPDARAFRRAWHIGDDDIVILSVARVSSLNRYKGFDTAVRIMPELLARHANVRWVVVGDGDDLEHYRTSARERGIAHAMHFTGYADDATLAQAYAACDMFALLSREERGEKGVMAEGYGIVFVEANSYGKPSVGLRAGGVPSAVLDGITGLLADVDDASIVRTIARLVEDRALAARLGADGERRAMTEGGWDHARACMLRTVAGLPRQRSRTAGSRV